MFYSFSAGIDYRRQNLPSLTSNVGPRAERVKWFARNIFNKLYNSILKTRTPRCEIEDHFPLPINAIS